MHFHEAFNSCSFYSGRVQSCVWRLPKYWFPTPLSIQRVCPPPRTKGGGYSYTLAGWRGGWGVNTLEDARHWIGLLQYNLSTPRINSQLLAGPGYAPPFRRTGTGGGRPRLSGTEPCHQLRLNLRYFTLKNKIMKQTIKNVLITKYNI